jgi:hypothetical protein
MKKQTIGMTVLLCVIAGTVYSQIAGQQPVEFKLPEPPPKPGGYYLGRQGWLPLSHMLIAERKVRKWYRALIPTLAPQGVLVFRGAEAPIKIDERKPLFFIRQQGPADGSARDVLMVRLQKKKDHRELPAMSGATIFNWKERIPREHIIPSTVSSVAPDAYTITPANGLAPGEYMLTFGTGDGGGYDFQISAGSALTP